MTKESYLKLKSDLKNIAKEIKKAKKIRRDAAKNYSKKNYSIKNITMQNSEKLLKRFKENPYGALFDSIKLVDKLKREFRHKHIVYCFARGKTLDQIEKKVKESNRVSTSLIDIYKKEYCFDEVIERVCSMKEVTKEQIKDKFCSTFCSEYKREYADCYKFDGTQSCRSSENVVKLFSFYKVFENEN